MALNSTNIPMDRLGMLTVRAQLAAIRHIKESVEAGVIPDELSTMRAVVVCVLDNLGEEGDGRSACEGA